MSRRWTRRDPPTTTPSAARSCHRCTASRFTVKDNIDLAGTPMTQGARVFADVYPTASSPDVDRLEAAGAIPVGRTNLATIGVRWHCESELWARRSTHGTAA